MDPEKSARAAGKALEQKAKAVIQSSNADGIPESPIANMGNVFLLNDASSARLLQSAIDALAAKAKISATFTADDKEFMTELFESLWYGGMYKGYYEAAILANHYVNGGGETLYVNSDVYRNSVIVQDTMAAMLAYAATTNYTTRDRTLIKSSDPGFVSSPHSAAVKKGKRKVNTQGYMHPQGALLTEQNNTRLKNTDHQFYLQLILRRNGWAASFASARDGARALWYAGAQGNTQALLGIGSYDGNDPSTAMISPDYSVQWRVDSRYDFEPYPTPYVTALPVSGTVKLSLPDGLSQHLTKIGVANVFEHYSEW